MEGSDGADAHIDASWPNEPHEWSYPEPRLWEATPTFKKPRADEEPEEGEPAPRPETDWEELELFHGAFIKALVELGVLAAVMKAENHRQKTDVWWVWANDSAQIWRIMEMTPLGAEPGWGKSLSDMRALSMVHSGALIERTFKPTPRGRFWRWMTEGMTMDDIMQISAEENTSEAEFVFMKIMFIRWMEVYGPKFVPREAAEMLPGLRAALREFILADQQVAEAERGRAASERNLNLQRGRLAERGIDLEGLIEAARDQGWEVGEEIPPDVLADPRIWKAGHPSPQEPVEEDPE